MFWTCLLIKILIYFIYSGLSLIMFHFKNNMSPVMSSIVRNWSNQFSFTNFNQSIFLWYCSINNQPTHGLVTCIVHCNTSLVLSIDKNMRMKMGQKSKGYVRQQERNLQLVVEQYWLRVLFESWGKLILFKSNPPVYGAIVAFFEYFEPLFLVPHIFTLTASPHLFLKVTTQPMLLQFWDAFMQLL